MIRIFGGGDKGREKAAGQPPPAQPPASAPPAPSAAEAQPPVHAEPVREQAPQPAAPRRVLLADDSPHAQRMGERILREVGYEVITVTDGETALMRLADADPDVVLADASLPGRSGYDICQEIKQDPRYSHVCVILTAGLLEAFDERRAAAVRSDGVLKKPFESTVLTEMVGKLAGAPRVRTDTIRVSSPPGVPARTAPVRPIPRPSAAMPISASRPGVARPAAMQPSSAQDAPPGAPGIVPVRVVTDPTSGIPAEIDAERVRAAVTLALDSALPGMIDKITERVLVALKQKTS
ncbi:MAG TPA: response regulator [Bryobacteraceae bacterium]|nr:response regulator [Bryobacteraceae bacterium]